MKEWKEKMDNTHKNILPVQTVFNILGASFIHSYIHTFIQSCRYGCMAVWLRDFEQIVLLRYEWMFV
jgi:hypothetical protein